MAKYHANHHQQLRRKAVAASISGVTASKAEKLGNKRNGGVKHGGEKRRYFRVAGGGIEAAAASLSQRQQRWHQPLRAKQEPWRKSAGNGMAMKGVENENWRRHHRRRKSGVGVCQRHGGAGGNDGIIW
jgi:hypothetical protein